MEPRSWLGEVHSRNVNEEPRSDVICSGTSNLEIQVEGKAAAQEEDVASCMGTASGQRVERSMKVKMYLLPSEGGRGLNVDMNVGESSLGLWESADRGFVVAMNFGGLA